RTFAALALYGYQVDEVIANRVFPQSQDGSAWQRSWVAAQGRELAAIHDSFAGLPVRQVGYRPAEPIGLEALRGVADELYGEQPGQDPAALTETGPLLSVTALADAEYQLSMRLPLAGKGEVSATRSGDELVVTVAGHRRVLALPSVLRRCEVTGGSVADGRLVLRFRPDARYWPAP
ncbi:MAG: ArsA family ATPase, partial [Actinomycetota bacterium]|nr:ArsA family ATPase [Actinomycetota bacterium]